MMPRLLVPPLLLMTLIMMSSARAGAVTDAARNEVVEAMPDETPPRRSVDRRSRRNASPNSERHDRHVEEGPGLRGPDRRPGERPDREPGRNRSGRR